MVVFVKHVVVHRLCDFSEKNILQRSVRIIFRCDWNMKSNSMTLKIGYTFGTKMINNAMFCFFLKQGVYTCSPAFIQ